MNKKILKFELVDVSFCGIKILSVIYVNISLMLNSFVIFLNKLDCKYPYIHVT